MPILFRKTPSPLGLSQLKAKAAPALDHPTGGGPSPFGPLDGIPDPSHALEQALRNTYFNVILRLASTVPSESSNTTKVPKNSLPFSPLRVQN